MTFSFDRSELREILQREYGRSGVLTRLPGENENYHLLSDKGEDFVIKVISYEYDHRLVELEIAAVEAAQAACPDLALPHFFRTLSGSCVVALSGNRPGEQKTVRLYEYVHGATWSDTVPISVEHAIELGRSTARFVDGLATLKLPSAHRTHQWDLSKADRHRSQIHLIEDHHKRNLVSRAFLLWSACARPYLPNLPHTLIHGDLNDENLRFLEGQLHGILDFGDCLFNPTICDLAIALTYLLIQQPDPLSLGALIVDGYHQIHPLSRTELEVLFPLICGRLAVSVVIAAQRRKIDPDRESWFVTETKAWEALELYMGIDPMKAAEVLAARTGIDVFLERGAAREELLEKRRNHFSPALSLTYQEPVKFIRGRGPYLIDERGRPYLDLYNNVPHVGHCHPRVVEAARRQMGLLNTNTRYLYDSLYEYAVRLCEKFPPPLDYCFFVNSGSEANELALRLTAAHTGNQDMLVLDGAYHGHTGKLIEISPYKFLGPGGVGKAKPWVHVLPVPDSYRGKYRERGSVAGIAYADDAVKLVRSLDRPIAAFISETMPSCAGQIIPPDGYFERIIPAIHEARGVCILDEVQVGFGRVGSHYWAFERYGVAPDIVVLGKPMGNGHPLGAVVTTRAIAESLARDGMEFFSTFGGNTVSCAIGLAVLDVIQDEGLQENALETGNYLRDSLLNLMNRHPLIGDVRGAGLFIGVELVKDRVSREPASEEADRLVNGLRKRQVLTGTDGLFHNVIKIKPPLVLSREDASMAVELFDEVLDSIPIP